jgi:hypothetical protein
MSNRIDLPKHPEGIQQARQSGVESALSLFKEKYYIKAGIPITGAGI